MTKKSLFLSLVVGVLFSAALHAQVVPFHAEGKNAEYSPISGTYSGSGVGVRLGTCKVEGFAIPTPTSNPLVLDWTGGGPVTAANGDQIFLTGGGQVQLVPLGGTIFSAVWSGNFNVVGGTGRFASAGPGTAPISVTAVNSPFDILNDPVWNFSWSLDGDINLGRKR